MRGLKDLSYEEMIISYSFCSVSELVQELAF